MIAKPAEAAFLKSQDLNAWPSKESGDLYASLNRDKPAKRPENKKPVGRFNFSLLELAIESSAKELNKLLTAAALKLKPVRRPPGFILQRTYNLKKRPIEIV
jgi:hypothetical protein